MVDITNQGFIDEHGNRMVRCWGYKWDEEGKKRIRHMYEVPEDPTNRRKNEDYVDKEEYAPSDSRRGE